MKPLNVDFAPKRRLPAWVLHVASALLLCLAAQQGWQAWQLSQAVQQTKARVAALQAQIDQQQRVQREAQSRLSAEPPYAKDLEAIMKVASFPLDKVFASIESAQVVGVKVTALDISATEGTVTAELEFSDHQALASYVEALNAGEPKPRWLLQQAKTGTAAAQGSATVFSRWP